MLASRIGTLHRIGDDREVGRCERARQRGDAPREAQRDEASGAALSLHLRRSVARR